MAKKLIIVLLLIYLAGVGAFSVFAFPNTTVNGVDKSFQPRDSVFISSTEGYELTVKGRSGKSATFNPASISYAESLVHETKLNQNQFAWPISFFGSHDYNVEYHVTYDEEKLNGQIASSAFLQNATAPADAFLELQGDSYVIVEEVLGDTVSADKIRETVLDSFKKREPEVTLEEEYDKPEITKDDAKLKEKLKTYNELAAFKITYDFEDRSEVLEGQALIDLYQDTESGFTLSEEKVRAYIQSLASKYDTFGATRTFQGTGVGEVTVKGGIYGWQTDVKASTDALVAAIKEAKTVTLEPVYKLKGLSRATDDIGKTYVEIDLTRQHLWYYKDGELVVDTPIVTGDPTKGRATPTGTGKIWSRETDRYLSGEGYRSHVDYWMPINWSGVGLHNASWRSSFGGRIYRGGGSHGCINMPFAPTKTLYQNTVVNTPVVVYQS